MLPTHHGDPNGDVPWGRPICLVTSRLHTQYSHVDGRQISFILGFSSQNNYSPKDSREYRSFLSITGPTAIAL